MLREQLPEFTNLLAGIAKAFSKELSDELIDFYWEMLSDFSFTEIKQAIFLHGTNPETGKFFPLPADIVAAIRGNPKDRALWAWAKIADAMRLVGAYSSIAFDDALIHVTLDDMGGWQKICATKVDHMPFVGKEFQERYRSYVLHAPPRHRSYFVGIVENQNSLCGYCYTPPVLFRDEVLARQVIASGAGAPLLECVFKTKKHEQVAAKTLLQERKT
jgi:hypothetical protein